MKNNFLYQTGIVIGKFQPFHNGHLYLLRYALKHAEHIIIGIGSANVYDQHNPFSAKERMMFVKQVIKTEQVENRVLRIIALDDFYDGTRWLKNIERKAVVNIDAIIGNNDWCNGIFSDAGYAVLRAGFYKRYLYEGEKIRRLMRLKKPWETRVPSYLVGEINKYIKEHKNHKFPFQNAALGGTFDHFHTAHEKFLTYAYRHAKHICVGITDEKLYAKKILSHTIEPIAVRTKAVKTFLKKRNYLSRTDFYILHDIYGPTKDDETLEAIIASKETFPNVLRINEERRKRNIPELRILIAPQICGNDTLPISSERIRKGDIDRRGMNYGLLMTRKNQAYIRLPKHLRRKLRNPLGLVFKGTDDTLKETIRKVRSNKNFRNSVMTIAVGDIISRSLTESGSRPTLNIIDYRSRRINLNRGQTLKGLSSSCENPAGTITRKSVEAIKKCRNAFLETKKPQTLIVQGEEDLLALPAILLAPLGSVVLYGQQDLGVVCVYVTEKKKKQIAALVKKFI